MLWWDVSQGSSAFSRVPVWRRTLAGVLKGRVKVVGDLVEGSGGLLVAILIDHVDLDVPFLHGKLGNGRLLVTRGPVVISLGARVKSATSRGRSQNRRMTSSHTTVGDTYMFFCSVTSLTFRCRGAMMSVNLSCTWDGAFIATTPFTRPRTRTGAHHRDAPRLAINWEIDRRWDTYFDLHLGWVCLSLALRSLSGLWGGLDVLVNEGCGRGRVGSALSIGSSRGSVPVQLVRQSGSRLVTTVGAVGWGHYCLGCLLRSDQLGEGSDWLGGWIARAVD